MQVSERMNKTQLIDKALEAGIEVDESETKAQIIDRLKSLSDSVIKDPKGSLKSHSLKPSKKKYEDHPKFQKFKKEGN